MKMNRFITTCCLMLAFVVTMATGGNALANGKGGRHQGPPPEAFTACEDKYEGDTAEFVNPHGETVTGICELQRERLVLRPDNHEGSNAREQGNSEKQ